MGSVNNVSDNTRHRQQRRPVIIKSQTINNNKNTYSTSDDVHPTICSSPITHLTNNTTDQPLPSIIEDSRPTISSSTNTDLSSILDELKIDS